MAAAKKANLHPGATAEPGAAAGWHFLTGTQPSIDRLTQAVGFRYAYDAQSDQFAHAAGIVVLTPAGRISRYFYDVHYSGRDLRLGLVEASQNGSARRSTGALILLPLRPDGWQVRRRDHEFRARGGVLTVIGLGFLFAGLMRGERPPPASTFIGSDRDSVKRGSCRLTRMRCLSRQRVAWFPPEASTTAAHVDHLLYFLLTVCGSVGLLVAFLMIYFCIRYRRRPGAGRPAKTHVLA